MRFTILAVIGLLASVLTSRADSATLDVSITSSDATTMWVELRLVDYNFQNACALVATCKIESGRIRVTPCPLDITELNGDWCEQGYMQASGPITRAVHVQLEIGKTHTFSGGAETVGFRREMSGACWEPTCEYFETVTPRVFTAETLRTANATWGKIKALYASP